MQDKKVKMFGDHLMETCCFYSEKHDQEKITMKTMLDSHALELAELRERIEKLEERVEDLMNISGLNRSCTTCDCLNFPCEHSHS